MAFDFLKSVFGDKSSSKAAPPGQAPSAGGPAVPVKTDELLPWMEKNLSSGIKDERARLSKLSSEIMKDVGQMREAMERIKKRTFEKGDKMYAAVNMIKDTWVKRALSAFSSHSGAAGTVGADSDFESFRHVYESTAKLLSELRLDPRQSIVISRYFERDSKKVGELLKDIGSSMDEMKEILDSPGSLKSVSRTAKLLSDLAEIRDEIGALQQDITEKDAKVSSRQEELSSMRKEKSDMDSSDEWKRLEAIGKGLKGTSSVKLRIEAEVSEKLGGMKRVFRKFGHDFPSLGKDETRLLESLSHSPVKAFVACDPGPLASILEMVDKAISDGDFRLSEKDSGKAEPLKDLISDGWVRKTKSSYESAIEKEKSLNEEKEKIRIEDARDSAERSLEKAGMELDALMKERDILLLRAKEKEAELNGKRREIEDFLRKDIGREVRLR